MQHMSDREIYKLAGQILANLVVKNSLSTANTLGIINESANILERKFPDFRREDFSHYVVKLIAKRSVNNVSDNTHTSPK